MIHRPYKLISIFLAASLAGLIPASSISATYAPTKAWATTTAENAAAKQAEADAVYDQIDSLQTSLNEAMSKHDEAEGNYTDANLKKEDAIARIQQETERIDNIKVELSDYAKGIYKDGRTSSFLDVIFQTTNFADFLTSWDVCSSISNRGKTLLQECQVARRQLQEARLLYEAESKRASEAMRLAQETMNQITQTQDSLRVEAAKLSAEAAELQAQAELEAEAARQAEEARRIREEQLANATYNPGYVPGAALAMGSGYFCNPCPNSVSSSGFGYRSFDNAFHKGLDMAAPEGTPFYAGDSGTVIFASNDGAYNGGAGNWVVISHGNGIITKYMHASATFVTVGEYVTRGQNIGAVGNTGNSFGAHLHFQVEVDGVAVNPLNYI